ncbi:MAG: hypothetical protein F6K54_28275 [Okeania sp. SIO3B5]|uniref:DUF5992 family protein n=1 Tax=Okeania sp. SIO3B5 TaxID=2607811 RepID=UPI0013FF4910|nr:DUF5992 family protein [Okeania sp. SIO3B5]NEO56630.1 hypothetical protein [Okeania sp. SIO3B5]
MSNIIKRLASTVVALALVVGVVFGVATPAHAGYLVTGASVVHVENTSSNGDNFAVLVKGGNGPCVDKYIIFPKSGVSNLDVYERGYEGALTALAYDLKVNVYDYSGDSCRNGGQLVVTK